MGRAHNGFDTPFDKPFGGRFQGEGEGRRRLARMPQVGAKWSVMARLSAPEHAVPYTTFTAVPMKVA